MLIILVFHTVLTVMEELREFGADGECTSSEPVAKLQYEPVAKLKYFHISTPQRIRSKLFQEAQCAGLVNQKDIIVQRRKKAAGPCLELKLVLDVATLVYHLRNRKILPRTILRNGKRSKQKYKKLRDHCCPINQILTQQEKRSQAKDYNEVENKVSRSSDIDYFEGTKCLQSVKEIQYTDTIIETVVVVNEKCDRSSDQVNCQTMKNHMYIFCTLIVKIKWFIKPPIHGTTKLHTRSIFSMQLSCNKVN